MLDILNQQLIDKVEIPICFDHDCREGICGACSLYINGRPHGPDSAITACQLHMRKFRDRQTIIVEPWRAKPFPVIKDLIVDRSAFDKIIEAGGYISVQTGGAPEANVIPIRKEDAEIAMDAAACIGCGACVAACKNASAMLFVAAKVSHFSRLPQGQMEARERVLKMVDIMDKLGFGNCTNTGACEAECPKQISIAHIAKLNREYLSARII
jgi:succinate dehydrogenase / fumarate reductase iron-sulfur subunit